MPPLHAAIASAVPPSYSGKHHPYPLDLLASPCFRSACPRKKKVLAAREKRKMEEKGDDAEPRSICNLTVFIVDFLVTTHQGGYLLLIGVMAIRIFSQVIVEYYAPSFGYKEYDDSSDGNALCVSRLASDPSRKYDFSAKRRKSDQAAHEPENGIICSTDRKSGKSNEPSERMSRFPRPKRGREIKHMDAEVNDTKARSRLRYPFSNNVMQNGQDGEHHARSNVSQIEDQSTRYTYSRKHSEAHPKDCLRSSHVYRETSTQAHGLRNSVRGDSEHENDDRCSELDRYSTRKWESERGGYKERERSSHRIGCDGHTDICNNQERHWDERRHASYSVEDERVYLHGSACEVRGRSSGYGRSDRNESAHHGNGEGTEMDRRSSSTRHKDDGRRKDTTNGSCKETDKVDNRREMKRFRVNEVDAHRAGEINGKEEHNDPTHANYSLSNDHKDRSRSGEKCTDANRRRKISEEMKEESCKEEDQDYFQQLANPEKIKEEARKTTDASLEKHRQHQLQKQQQESVLCCDSKEVKSLDRDAAATELKDANSNILTAKGEIENNHESSNMFVNEKSYTVGKSPPTQPNISVNLGISGDRRTTGVSGLGEGIPMSERSSDGLRIEKNAQNALRDNWDDEEGYYTYHLGEVLDGCYRITAGHGKGVFSTVVQAKDLKAGNDDHEEVAIKIICNDDTKTKYKSGKSEVSILEKLSSADREDKRHCVRFISSFMYRGHLCLVLESLHMNLREVIKKFGRDIGLKLTAVRAYSKQLFIALKHLRNCSILHCDIKPDNILVNEAKSLLKLCDFGSASSAGTNEITPYLVSRFYRAPEIILGLPYDHSLDMWSVGCCLYELYAGKFLFPGRTNNHMLWLHMELKGPFPKKMLRKGAFTTQHFDQDLNFHASEENLMTKMAVKRLLMNVKPKGVGSVISSFPGEDPKMLSNFKDLLERILVLDPKKRLTVSQALSHPFITGK